jgi:hypothetical protein
MHMPSYAQSSYATLLIHQDFRQTSLEAALASLEDSYGIQLAYESHILQGKTVDVKIEGLGLPQTLELLLKDTGFSYLIVDYHKVLIRPQPRVTYQLEEQLRFSGQVSSKLSAEPLSYATIYIKGTSTGTYTDENGIFHLNVQKQALPLTACIQYLGYEEQQIGLNVASANQMMDIRLATRRIEIPAITIVETPPMLSSVVSGSALSIKVEELSRLPGFLGGKDLMRQLQMLPGVSAHNDRSSGLEVRAGDEGDNLILLDGIPLFQANHYFGIFSALNTYSIDEARLYKNAFPAEYGGRTASILEVSGRSGLDQAFGGRAELNLLLSNLHLFLPLSSKMALVASGRITNQNAAESQLFGQANEDEPLHTRFSGLNDRPERSIVNVSPDFRFYDTHIKWDWNPSDKNQFSASLFKSFDKFNYRYALSFPRLILGQSSSYEELYQEEHSWQNNGLSMRYRRQWKPDIHSEFLFAHARFESDRQVRYTLTPPMILQKSPRDIFNQQENEISNYTFKWINDWALREQESFKLGYEFEQNRVRHEIALDSARLMGADRQASLHSLFAEYQRSWTGGFSTTIGLRNTLYPPTGKLYLSPRLQVNYQATEQLRIKSSLSYYNQFLRTFNYEDRFGRNFNFWVLANDRNIPVASSQQIMLGMNTLTRNGWAFDVELYAKTIDGSLTFVGTRPSLNTEEREIPDAYRLFRGEGRSYGIDLLVKKQWNAYQSWLAYTLSKTENRFPAINQNNYYPAQNDRRHQLKWIHLYRVGRWDFSLAYIFSSGRPYIDVGSFQLEESRQDVELDNFIGYIDDYHRVDIGLHYQFPLLGTTANIEASVFNLFDRENVAYRQFTYSLAGQTEQGPARNIVLGNDLELLQRTFNLGLSIEF